MTSVYIDDTVKNNGLNILKSNFKTGANFTFMYMFLENFLCKAYGFSVYRSSLIASEILKEFITNEKK